MTDEKKGNKKREFVAWAIAWHKTSGTVTWLTDRNVILYGEWVTDATKRWVIEDWKTTKVALKWLRYALRDLGGRIVAVGVKPVVELDRVVHQWFVGFDERRKQPIVNEPEALTRHLETFQTSVAASERDQILFAAEHIFTKCLSEREEQFMKWLKKRAGIPV